MGQCVTQELICRGSADLPGGNALEQMYRIAGCRDAQTPGQAVGRIGSKHLAIEASLGHSEGLDAFVYFFDTKHINHHISCCIVRNNSHKYSQIAHGWSDAAVEVT